jgi:serine/threonine-protein kinase HipA
MSSRQRLIQVYLDDSEAEEPRLMGVLSATQLRGKEVFSFAYEPTFLQSSFTHALDPDLQFFGGNQFVRDEKPNFGLFLDSSPDRWGRLLMRRREAILARQEGRRENVLFESDYLLGVYDEHRMGAIRFKTNEKGPFLNNDAQMAAPPFTSLRQLEQASLIIEQATSADSPDYLKWLNLLIAPGSSLGGARPKASVKDPKNALWIAKFPSTFDNRNIGAWEMLTHTLAQRSGIEVADAFAQSFHSRYHTFLTKRFDRTAGGGRVHFASAMTLLGFSDGQNYQDGISYLHLAEWIMRYGANAKLEADLEQLWRRIVFSICVSNADDHLRNHGFLLTPTGWKLSPAYDLNPVETATGLSLNISDTDNSLELDLALEVASFCRLKESQARQIIREIQIAVRTWPAVAQQLGIPRNEQELVARAFRKAEPH